jgi:hypothetical protein
LAAFCALSLVAAQAQAGIGSALFGFVAGSTVSSGAEAVSVVRSNAKPACFAMTKTSNTEALVNLSSVSYVDWNKGAIYFKSGIGRSRGKRAAL